MWNAFSRGSAVAEGPHIRGTLHWSVSLLCPRLLVLLDVKKLFLRFFIPVTLFYVLFGQRF